MDQKQLREQENRCIQEQAPACAATCPVHVDGRGIAAEIAKGRTIVVWHEAANFPMWEQPEQYSNEITEFLRS